MVDDDAEALLAQDPSLPRLSDADFALFQALIRREAGISLAETKRNFEAYVKTIGPRHSGK